MPGDVGMVAGLLDTIAKWVLSEDGYGTWSKARKLAALKIKAQQAIEDGNWTAAHALTDELSRLANQD